MLLGLFTVVSITKLCQWCGARCHKCKDVQSDVAVVRRLAHFRTSLWFLRPSKVCEFPIVFRFWVKLCTFRAVTCHRLSFVSICIVISLHSSTPYWNYATLRHPVQHNYSNSESEHCCWRYPSSVWLLPVLSSRRPADQWHSLHGYFSLFLMPWISYFWWSRQLHKDFGWRFFLPNLD